MCGLCIILGSHSEAGRPDCKCVCSSHLSSGSDNLHCVGYCGAGDVT